MFEFPRSSTTYTLGLVELDGHQPKESIFDELGMRLKNQLLQIGPLDFDAMHKHRLITHHHNHH